MKYDKEVAIAIGRSRKELNWINKNVLWSEFVNKIKNTTRTAETYNEYASSKKERQSEIKDVGGFVGGFLANGKRTATSVVNRTLITLDIDHATNSVDIFEDFELLYGNACVMYSTHSHSPNKPKLRLIIPLDREVFVDEYEAISRKIAGDLGINNFDDTTFQPSRLMYFPSTSKDGEFIYRNIDSEFLSADEILDTYTDYKDSSSWEVSDRVPKIIERKIKKQGDPLAKDGVIGAFCRSYTIHDVIDKYLKGVYGTTSDSNRYTYVNGSTSGGLVVYDDKFAYSHHGTDPVSGKMCNAFDLVRLHKFKLEDENVDEKTPSNRLPSYKAMIELALKDENVKKLISVEKLKSVKNDFADIDTDADDDSWTVKLDIDNKGKIKTTIDNILLICANDINLKNKLALNKFSNKAILLKDVPWRKISNGKEFKDVDESGLRYYLENVYNITGKSKIEDALALTLENNSFHPIKKYFDTLVWDGVKRAETLFIDYLGAKDTEYTRAVTKKALTACVARIKEPGCKFDYVLTLTGAQGIGKSTIFKKLGKSWFSDSFTTVQGKEAVEQIQGYWIIEMGELASLKKAELETTKHFISKREDVFRKAYGRRTEEYPRQCVFFGTTNVNSFLTDNTGNRRFWVVETMVQTPTKDVFTIDNDTVNQIWAEVLHLYNNGEKLYLPKEIEIQAKEVQEKHKVIDERAGVVEEYLNTLLPENWYDLDLFERRNYFSSKDDIQQKGVMERTKVCVLEVWIECLGGQKKDIDRRKSNEIANILGNIDGWEKHKSTTKTKGYGIQRGFIKNGVN